MTPNTMKYQSTNRLKLSNVRGLMSKLPEIHLMLTRDKPLLFLLTETWLTNRCPNGLLQIQGYQIVRRDRKGKRGGGILCFIHESLQWVHRTDLSTNNEDVWLELFCQGRNIIMCLSYRPPNEQMAAFLNNAETSLEKAFSETPRLILAGDYNARNCHWLSSDPMTSDGMILENWLSSFLLHQVVSTATREGNGCRSLLDIIATSEPHLVHKVLVNSPIGKSDHSVVDLIFDIDWCRIEMPKRDIWLFHLADREGLLNALNLTDWQAALKHSSCDDSWQHWKELIFTAASTYIPKKTVEVNVTPKPWIKPSLKNLIKEKHRLWKKYQKERTTESFDKFKHIRNQVTKLLRQAQRNHFVAISDLSNSQSAKKFLENYKSPSRHFWLSDWTNYKP